MSVRPWQPIASWEILYTLGSARELAAPKKGTPLSELEQALPESMEGLWLIGFDARGPKLRAYTGTAYLVEIKGSKHWLLGEPVAWAFHPGQVTTTAAPDVDGDGRADIAWTIPGIIYECHALRRDGRFDPVTKTQPAFRNTRQDGRNPAGSLVYPATGIQYHAGLADRPSSIGCWTSPPADFERVAEIIEAHPAKTFRVAFALR